jgi:hypothetical protein
MRYWVMLFTEFRTFTFTANNIIEAYNFYFEGKEKEEIIRGQILDNESREIFAEFGYDE